MRILGFLFLVLCLYASDGLYAQQSKSVLPHVIIYKTKKDYRQYVPVQLSSDRKTVASYPDPADIKTGSGYPLPVLLHKGYLFDKRGVGLNTAYLKMTWQEYAALPSVPTRADLYNMITDKNPIKELYDCGVRNPQKNSLQEINRVIDQRQLDKKYKKIR